MLKHILLTSIAVIFLLSARAQLPGLVSNTSAKDRAESLVYKNYQGKYDFMIAYTTQSYWWGNKASLKILAFKDGVWLKGDMYSQMRKDNTWRKPMLILKEVDADSAMYMVKHLDSAGFYKLNRDSLNITSRKVNNYVELFSISDGVNYRFEILTKTDFAIIESYAPDEILKKWPDLKIRGEFINVRDWFLQKYKKLSVSE